MSDKNEVPNRPVHLDSHDWLPFTALSPWTDAPLFWCPICKIVMDAAGVEEWGRMWQETAALREIAEAMSDSHYFLTNDQTFNITNQNRSIVTLKTDGSVEFGPDMTPGEAARQFWEFLAQQNPLHGEVKKLQAETAALREIAEAVAALDWDESWAVADFCPFCASTLWQGEPDHHLESCPVIKARALLGTPHA